MTWIAPNELGIELLTKLPRDLLCEILLRLEHRDLVNLSLTCKSLQQTCKDEAIWKFMCLKRWQLEEFLMLRKQEVVSEELTEKYGYWRSFYKINQMRVIVQHMPWWTPTDCLAQFKDWFMLLRFIDKRNADSVFSSFQITKLKMIPIWEFHITSTSYYCGYVAVTEGLFSSVIDFILHKILIRSIAELFFAIVGDRWPKTRCVTKHYMSFRAQPIESRRSGPLNWKIVLNDNTLSFASKENVDIVKELAPVPFHSHICCYEQPEKLFRTVDEVPPHQERNVQYVSTGIPVEYQPVGILAHQLWNVHKHEAEMDARRLCEELLANRWFIRIGAQAQPNAQTYLTYFKTSSQYVANVLYVPVYEAAYTYKENEVNKQYTVVMDGVTGQLRGTRPWNLDTYLKSTFVAAIFTLCGMQIFKATMNTK